MAYWDGVLFSGSTITGSAITGISTEALQRMPRGAVTRAIYMCQSASGASGAFGVRIFGHIGGITFPIAGRTNISGVGTVEIWGTLGGSSTCLSTRPCSVEIAPTIGGAVATSYTVVIGAALVTE